MRATGDVGGGKGGGAVACLLEGLDRAFDVASWHGPNLRGVLRGLTAARAAWRPAPDRHNIAEHVLHAAYWKYAARRRLRGGEPRGSFPIRGSNWFPVPGPLPEGDWRGHLTLLDEQHRALREAVAELDPARLGEAVGSQGKSTRRSLVLGVAAHDVYHAGQIQLLKRLQG
jgi:hypothetical protein